MDPALALAPKWCFNEPVIVVPGLGMTLTIGRSLVLLVLGYAVAFIGTRIVAGVLKEKLGLVVEPVFDPQITFIVLVASIALAALAGLIPAAVAYRTSVARNLRPTD